MLCILTPQISRMSIQRPKMYIPPKIRGKSVVWKQPIRTPMAVRPSRLLNHVRPVQAMVVKTSKVPPKPLAATARRSTLIQPMVNRVRPVQAVATQPSKTPSKSSTTTVQPPLHPTINMESSYLGMEFIVSSIQLTIKAMRQAGVDLDKAPKCSKGRLELHWIQQAGELVKLAAILQFQARDVQRLGIDKLANAKY